MESFKRTIEYWGLKVVSVRRRVKGWKYDNRAHDNDASDQDKGVNDDALDTIDAVGDFVVDDDAAVEYDAHDDDADIDQDKGAYDDAREVETERS